MGFRRGFAGGVTLTIGILYLAVKSPKYDGLAQSVIFQSQSLRRNSLHEPRTRRPQGNTPYISRIDGSKSFVENLKSRWNEEIEDIAWWINQKGWNMVRDEAEKGIIQLIGRPDERSETTHDSETNPLSKLQEVADKGKETISKAMVTIMDGTKAKVEDSIRATENLTTNAHNAILNSIDNRLDQEKEFVDSTSKKSGPALTSPFPSQSGTIEETLQRRYVTSTSNKNVEETLEDRYKPVEESDLNT